MLMGDVSCGAGKGAGVGVASVAKVRAERESGELKKGEVGD
jgi:hypothetical protein